jgi:hypothetical protein
MTRELFLRRICRRLKELGTLRTSVMVETASEGEDVITKQLKLGVQGEKGWVLFR